LGAGVHDNDEVQWGYQVMRRRSKLDGGHTTERSASLPGRERDQELLLIELISLANASEPPPVHMASTGGGRCASTLSLISFGHRLKGKPEGQPQPVPLVVG